MTSDLADGIERIVPFVRRIQEEALYSDMELMGEIIRKVYNLVLDAAEFISNYVRKSAMSLSFTIRRRVSLNLNRKGGRFYYICGRSEQNHGIGRGPRQIGRGVGSSYRLRNAEINEAHR